MKGRDRGDSTEAGHVNLSPGRDIDMSACSKDGRMAWADTVDCWMNWEPMEAMTMCRER